MQARRQANLCLWCKLPVFGLCSECVKIWGGGGDECFSSLPLEDHFYESKLSYCPPAFPVSLLPVLGEYLPNEHPVCNHLSQAFGKGCGKWEIPR